MVLGGAGDGLRLGILQTGLPRTLLISHSESHSNLNQNQKNYQKLDK